MVYGGKKDQKSCSTGPVYDEVIRRAPCDAQSKGHRPPETGQHLNTTRPGCQFRCRRATMSTIATVEPQKLGRNGVWPPSLEQMR